MFTLNVLSELIFSKKTSAKSQSVIAFFAHQDPLHYTLSFQYSVKLRKTEMANHIKYILNINTLKFPVNAT